jgi:glutamate-1-semialdehyde aminotransferase
MKLHDEKSRQLLRRAAKNIPGAVNSPVRAWSAVNGSQLFIDHALGAHIFDADGNRFIDYVGSYGPAILGHANPQVADAVAAQAKKGFSFGASTELEVELAEIISGAIRAAEKVRLVSSGTEAGMTAVRLARAATGRQKIIKFDGCYHGHSDGLLVRAGSGGMTLGVPDSAGVPQALAAMTVTARYNSLESVGGCFEANPGSIAAVIVEPIAANMGVVPLLRFDCRNDGSYTGSDHAGKNNRRWITDRSNRRSLRSNGSPRAHRTGLSGRNSFGESDFRASRIGDAETACAGWDLCVPGKLRRAFRERIE